MAYESVQEMFGRMAAQYGPQVAIDRGGKRITYASLETESNRLANFLREGGAGRETMVGLLTDDPVLIVTGILGVLKAGAVFVPLDPTFPEGRLQVMSDQVQPQWYVSETKHLEKLHRLGGTKRAAKVVCFGDDEYSRYQNLEPVKLPADPEAPCSIYFTSGSTGRPKAIVGRL